MSPAVLGFRSRRALRQDAGVHSPDRLAPTLAPRPYLLYGFNIVYIKTIDWSAGGGDELPVERVTFVYGALGPRLPPGEA
jgi:hypothetical protein